MYPNAVDEQDLQNPQRWDSLKSGTPKSLGLSPGYIYNSCEMLNHNFKG